MIFEQKLKGQRIWFDPKTLTVLDRKQKGAFCFSSKAEYRVYLLLDKLCKEIGAKLLYEKPFLYTYAGERKKWKVDFTIEIGRNRVYVEYKSAFSLSRGKKFRRDIKEIYQSVPHIARNILICSFDDIYVKISEDIKILAVHPREIVYTIKQVIKERGF